MNAALSLDNAGSRRDTAVVEELPELSAISEEFEVALPREMCDRLGILPGDQLEADVADGRLILQKRSGDSTESGPERGELEPNGA